MAISVIEPIGLALTRTGRMLFKPFEWRKWFVLGFCAWLAQLGQGGVNFNFRVGGPFESDGRGGPGPFEPIVEWAKQHLTLLVVLAVVVFLVMVAVGLVILWLSSRGKFMFLDGVVRNRGAVVEPWHRFRTPSNSLFWFRLLLFLVAFPILVLILALVGLLVRADILAGHLTWPTIIIMTVGIPLFAFGCVILAAAVAVLEDFLVPVMYLRGVRTLAAWGIVWREILPGNFWKIVLFYLMKIVLGIGIAVVAILATCFTCCLTVIPYLGTVILLPIFVFSRSYSLYFLQQFGPQWQFFPVGEVPSPQGLP